MRHLKIRIYILIAVIIILAIFSHLIYIKNEPTQTKEKQLLCLNQTTKFLNSLKKQKQGLFMVRDAKTNVAIYNESLASITSQFNKIWGEQLSDLAPLQLQAEPTERKFFLRFSNSTNNFDCNIVTLGVGGMVQAEMELKSFYPRCKFLALDPASGNEDLVKNKLNGTFIKGVIGSEDSDTVNMRPNIYGNAVIDFSQPIEEPPIGFFDFFLYYTAEGVIDMLSIDIEGSEYGIFQLLAEHYDQLPIILCQINIEFHHHPMFANFFLRQRFFRNLDTFIRHNRFALMNAESFFTTYMSNSTQIFHRMFFINYVDKICVEKFLC